MMKPDEINLRKLSDRALADLIKLAMDEFTRRLSSPQAVSIKVLEEPIEVIITPADREMVFVRNCIRIFSQGDYVLAEMKDKYKDLYKKYPAWFRQQGYPSDLRGRSAQRHMSYYSSPE